MLLTPAVLIIINIASSLLRCVMELFRLGIVVPRSWWRAFDHNITIAELNTVNYKDNYVKRMYACAWIAVSAKFVYNIDFHALENPTEESEQFVEAVSLFLDCLGRMIVEPPLYKLYPNKLYRDFNKALRVRQLS